MRKDLDISICVPALNEEGSLKEAVDDLISTLSSCVGRLEVIVVNDGSTDRTSQIADDLGRRYKQVKTIHHERKSGIGACFRDALMQAEGRYFTWFPGDHENSAEEFIRCLPHLDGSTIVTCHHYGYDTRSSARRFISRSYTWILNRCFRLNVNYYNGLTVFPASLLRSFPLVAEGFALLAENLIRASRQGYRIAELSAPLRERKWGRSKALTLRSVAQMGRDASRILLNALNKQKEHDSIP